MLADGRRYDADDPQLAAAFGGMREQAHPRRRCRARRPSRRSSAPAPQTGAAAVDLESGAVAQIAVRNRLPFAVLRAICDPADRALPPSPSPRSTARAGCAWSAMLAAILRHPGQVPALLALGQDAAAARAALLKQVKRTGRLG